MHCNSRVVILALFLIAHSAASQAVIVDDHFTGDSAGVPAGWAMPPNVNFGTAVESGTVVTLLPNGEEEDQGVAILSDESYSPQGVVTTMVVALVLPSDGEALLGIADGSPVNQFLIASLMGDGSVSVTAANTFEGESPHYLGGNVPGYTDGGAITATFVFDDDSFSLSTDIGGFTTGDVLYSTLTDFSFSGLGASVHAVLAAGTESGSVAFDRVTLSTLEAVPEPGGLILALIGMLTLRRRLNFVGKKVE